MKHLMTIKKMHETTGLSISFIKQLLRDGKLTRYKINSATLVSLKELEEIAKS